MAVPPSPKQPFVAFAISPSRNSIPPIQVAWRTLSITTTTTNRKAKQADTKAILDHVTGDALPHQLLAVVGPNGSGKTSLLKCLIDPSTATMGKVVISGDESVEVKTVSFIPQVDLLQPALTIQDHLSIQAQLRLPTKPTPTTTTDHIERVLAQVNLTEQTHTQIGQLPSNADRKLVAIAAELLTSPSVLILDEPTHGLDSVDADRVVNTLHQLARYGHTVIASFHETTSSVFRLADKLHLLAEGRTVYRGTPSGMVSHFESHSVPFPPFTNPLEFYIQFVTPSKSDLHVNHAHHLISAWSVDSALAVHNEAVLCEVVRSPVSFPRSSLSQLGIQFVQNGRRILCDKSATIRRSVMMVGEAVVLGLVFSRLSISQRDMQPLTSATFFFAAAQFIPTVLLELRTAPSEVTIAVNEHEHGRAHVLVWYLVKNVIEIPLQLFFPMLFLVPAYFIVGFPVDAEIFFSFYWFIVLVVMAATSVGYFASSAAPKPMAIGIPIIAFSLLLGGAFVNRMTTPSYLLWLQQILPIKYTYHGMMRAFWSKVDSIYCPPGVNCRATTGLGVLTVNVIKPDHFKSDSLILFAIIMAFRVAGAGALWLRTRK